MVLSLEVGWIETNESVRACSYICFGQKQICLWITGVYGLRRCYQSSYWNVSIGTGGSLLGSAMSNLGRQGQPRMLFSLLVSCRFYLCFAIFELYRSHNSTLQWSSGSKRRYRETRTFPKLAEWFASILEAIGTDGWSCVSSGRTAFGGGLGSRSLGLSLLRIGTLSWTWVRNSIRAGTRALSPMVWSRHELRQRKADLAGQRPLSWTYLQVCRWKRTEQGCQCCASRSSRSWSGRREGWFLNRLNELPRDSFTQFIRWYPIIRCFADFDNSDSFSCWLDYPCSFE